MNDAVRSQLTQSRRHLNDFGHDNPSPAARWVQRPNVFRVRHNSEPAIGATMTETAESEKWFRRLGSDSRGGVQMVCFPHAGASASSYFALSRILAPDVNVLAVQYPGRLDRRHEPMVADLHALADQIAHALPAALDNRAVAFFGYSMGAIVAYEVARRLDNSRARPGVLFVAARRAPSRSQRGRVLTTTREVVTELTKLGGTSAEVLDDDELRALFMPVIRADYEAMARYRAVDQGVVRCPISVMTGSADPLTSIEDAQAWERHTDSTAELTVFEGGHFFIDTQLQEVASRLTEHLRMFAN